MYQCCMMSYSHWFLGGHAFTQKPSSASSEESTHWNWLEEDEEALNHAPVCSERFTSQVSLLHERIIMKESEKVHSHLLSEKAKSGTASLRGKLSRFMEVPEEKVHSRQKLHSQRNCLMEMPEKEKNPSSQVQSSFLVRKVRQFWKETACGNGRGRCDVFQSFSTTTSTGTPASLLSSSPAKPAVFWPGVCECTASRESMEYIINYIDIT